MNCLYVSFVVFLCAILVSCGGSSGVAIAGGGGNGGGGNNNPPQVNTILSIQIMGTTDENVTASGQGKSVQGSNMASTPSDSDGTATGFDITFAVDGTDLPNDPGANGDNLDMEIDLDDGIDILLIPILIEPEV